jgi:hypothetical protein
MERTHRPILALGIAVLIVGALVSVAIPAFAVHGGGRPPPKPANLVWHDDVQWNTVILGPLHGRAPDHTLDALYFFEGGTRLVAGAGPGDSDYNGGRWQPFVCDSGGFTDGDAVEAAIRLGSINCVPGGGPFLGQNFLCPLTNRNA